MVRPHAKNNRFTHVDPFEDTESGVHHEEVIIRLIGFTHVDPFEDTESLLVQC